ncbi:SDR family oxidoreductase [Kaustia mangrovi]|uniref:SDR family oxidoreductase n=1 Tax=Kaustia mangrovi TaxID=2593653 RepID=A0A7S8HB90_9HYPH|nr:SDR family oxidoreductase [Kaustia mangrovi]QPC42256.1 SDR family oxidoreductase [Kaustia mangrovi]
MPDAEGRTLALITGASGGIGEAFAREIAADGHAVALVARDEDQLNRVAGVIASTTDMPAYPIVLDLAEPDAADRLIAALTRRGLDPDILVNNAGFGLVGPALELDRSEQVAMIDLNVRALADLALALLPAMRERGTGGIVNMASLASFMPGPGMAVYYATKAFVLSFSEALSSELAGTGVTVTAVCPGPVPTGFQPRSGMEEVRAYRRARKMSAPDVARLGWAGFKQGKRTVIPGLSTYATAQFVSILPRGLLLPAIKFFQRKD